MPFCRGCGKEILWIETAKNKKWIPVDHTPKRIHPGDEGKFVLENGRVVDARNIQDDYWGYTPHWATCPKAKEFKKRRG